MPPDIHSTGGRALVRATSSVAKLDARARQRFNLFSEDFSVFRVLTTDAVWPRANPPPSVNIASACDTSQPPAWWFSGARGASGHENVPLLRSQRSGARIPVPSQRMILIRVSRRLLNTNSAPLLRSSPVLGHQGVQPVEPFAHVAGAHRHKYLQAAPREAQHGKRIVPARPLPRSRLFFIRPLPAEPRRATATPARCRSQPLAAIQQRLPIAVAEAAAPTVCRHDCVSPSWPGLNILIQSAAQTGEVLRRCGPMPSECPAVVPSIPAAALSCPRSLATSATHTQAPQEHYQNHSLLS